MNEALLTGLATIVGPRWLRQRRAELATYTMDGLPTHESYPGVVVLPGSRDELIAVMKELHATRTPFVARGAGTGLSGGALAGGDAADRRMFSCAAPLGPRREREFDRCRLRP